MTAAPKRKVSVTLSADLLDAIDRAADRDPSATRSGVMEEWLRRGRNAKRAADLRAATIAYYESLSEDEEREHEAIAQASARAARSLAIDVPARRRGGPPR